MAESKYGQLRQWVVSNSGENSWQLKQLDELISFQPKPSNESADIKRVFESWRELQRRPNACRLGPGAKRAIKRGLQETDADSLILIIQYAYKSDDAQPRFWRGQNAQKATFLGLDNLFRSEKIAARLQNALAWRSQNADRVSPSGDGTDLGPMAKYRRGRTV